MLRIHSIKGTPSLTFQIGPTYCWLLPPGLSIVYSRSLITFVAIRVTKRDIRGCEPLLRGLNAVPMPLHFTAILRNRTVSHSTTITQPRCEIHLDK
jgi:hypothetical protein